MGEYIVISETDANEINGSRVEENVVEFRKLNTGFYAAPIAVLNDFESILGGINYTVEELDADDFFLPQYNDVRK